MGRYSPEVAIEGIQESCRFNIPCTLAILASLVVVTIASQILILIGTRLSLPRLCRLFQWRQPPGPGAAVSKSESSAVGTRRGEARRSETLEILLKPKDCICVQDAGLAAATARDG